MKIKKLHIEDVCDFIGGSQPPKSTFSNLALTGYIRLIQIRDYKTDNFKTFIPESSTTKFCDEKDIMIGRYGPPIFQICRGLKGAYNVALLKAKPKLIIDIDYLYYFLKQKNVFEYVDKLSSRTGGQTGVDLDCLNKYPIILPVDKHDQKTIAGVLSSLDTKIELNNKICSELESLAQNLYHYWFTQFDFPNEKGNPYRSSGGKMVWNKELEREIPERWEVHKLIDIVPIVLGGTPDTSICSYWDNGSINWLSSGEIANFPVLSADAKISQEAIDNSATVLLRTGSVALSITRYIRPTILGIDACINQSIVGIEESAIYKHSFLYPFIKSQVSKYMGLRTGAMQPHINKTTVEDTPIICPPDRVLHEYYKTADLLFAQIMTIARESLELAQLRDFLLPLLMNGQVSVCE